MILADQAGSKILGRKPLTMTTERSKTESLENQPCRIHVWTKRVKFWNHRNPSFSGAWSKETEIQANQWFVVQKHTRKKLKLYNFNTPKRKNDFVWSFTFWVVLNLVSEKMRLQGTFCNMDHIHDCSLHSPRKRLLFAQLGPIVLKVKNR